MTWEGPKGTNFLPSDDIGAEVGPRLAKKLCSLTVSFFRVSFSLFFAIAKNGPPRTISILFSCFIQKIMLWTISEGNSDLGALWEKITLEAHQFQVFGKAGFAIFSFLLPIAEVCDEATLQTACPPADQRGAHSTRALSQRGCAGRPFTESACHSELHDSGMPPPTEPPLEKQKKRRKYLPMQVSGAWKSPSPGVWARRHRHRRWRGRRGLAVTSAAAVPESNAENTVTENSLPGMTPPAPDRRRFHRISFPYLSAGCSPLVTRAFGMSRREVIGPAPSSEPSLR